MVELTFTVKKSVTNLIHIVVFTCVFPDEMRLVNSNTGQNVNAKSLIGLSGFRHEPKDVLILQVSGNNEDEIALKFNDFIKNNF